MLSSSRSRNSTIVRSQNGVRLARAALQAAYFLSDDLGNGLAERLFTTPRRYPRPDRERAILATARPFEVDVVLRSPRWSGQSLKLAAWRWGFGPTVLLVHGWEGRGSQLGSFVEPLVAAGLSVVAFDAPAHGDSPGTRLYLTDYADAVADVVAASGPVHAIIAHSFGAAATLFARERGGVDAARNIMIAPNVLIDDAVDKFASHVALDAADRERFTRALAVHTGVPVGALGLDALIGTRESGMLVIHDRADREVGFDHGEQLARRWPKAQLVATEGLGHRRILRDAEVIARTVAFASLGARRPVSDLVREVDRWLATDSLLA